MFLLNDFPSFGKRSSAAGSPLRPPRSWPLFCLLSMKSQEEEMMLTCCATQRSPELCTWYMLKETKERCTVVRGKVPDKYVNTLLLPFLILRIKFEIKMLSRLEDEGQGGKEKGKFLETVRHFMEICAKSKTISILCCKAQDRIRPLVTGCRCHDGVCTKCYGNE